MKNFNFYAPTQVVFGRLTLTFSDATFITC